MPNDINAAGISVETYSETVDAIVNGTSDAQGLKQIYGSDINVDQNSPDGQMINIFALSKQDILSLIVQDYNSKDPDQAVGAALDGVSQLCGITRKGGTYTRTNVSITASKTVTLNGLDGTGTPFTVSDSTGNLFYLEVGATLTAGSTSKSFRSANIGSVTANAGTLTIIKTPTAGITAVTNSSAPIEVGADQETDAQLRIRRQRSVALPALGWYAGLYAAILSLDGVIECKIIENTTNSTDSDSIPAHGIWVIVDGGTAADIASTIYRYRNAGCAMKGSVSTAVTQIDGSTFNVKHDVATQVPLYIKITASSVSGGAVDSAAIQSSIVNGYVLGIFETADITSITAVAHAANPDLLVTACSVCATSGGTFVSSLTPITKDKRFVMSTGNITVTVA